MSIFILELLMTSMVKKLLYISKTAGVNMLSTRSNFKLKHSLSLSCMITIMAIDVVILCMNQH
jgi:hypothetical protein